MAGLVLDILLEFLFRSMARILNILCSHTWPVITGSMAGPCFMPAQHSCEVAVIRYQYSVADERYEGVYKEPFLFKNYGEAYLRRFPTGVDHPVRVKPGDPSISVPVRT